MLCPCIAELDRLDEFLPPAVVCHAMGTRDSHYILGRWCVYGITHMTSRAGSPALVAAPVIPLGNSDMAVDCIRVLGIDLGRT